MNSNMIEAYTESQDPMSSLDAMLESLEALSPPQNWEKIRLQSMNDLPQYIQTSSSTTAPETTTKMEIRNGTNSGVSSVLYMFKSLQEALDMLNSERRISSN